MRTAIIDLGTNTFNLIIADVHPENNYEIIYRQKLPAKLGKGGINDNYITPEAFQRGLYALKIHKNTICKYDNCRVYAYATSAIRGANNGLAFVEEVRNRLGINIRILSGEEEAELIYHGIKQAVPLQDEKVLMVDIGGGSNELIIANRDEIFWKQSFQLGILRIMDRFRPCEPILKAEEEAIEDYINMKLPPLYEAVEKFPVTTLVGSSGSFTTLLNMIFLLHHAPEEIDGLTYHKIDMDGYRKLHYYLLGTTLEERMRIKGMDHSKVEMIVVASIFVKYLIKRLGIKNIIQSNFALKEGVISRIMQNENHMDIFC